jgi:purine-cytosine permease-like protein
MAVSLVDSNTFNAYSGAFQVLAFGGMWRRFKAESVTIRVVPLVCVMAVGVVTACSVTPGTPAPEAAGEPR